MNLSIVGKFISRYAQFTTQQNHMSPCFEGIPNPFKMQYHSHLLAKTGGFAAILLAPAPNQPKALLKDKKWSSLSFLLRVCLRRWG